jgi:hypothetical protein
MFRAKFFQFAISFGQKLRTQRKYQVRLASVVAATGFVLFSVAQEGPQNYLLFFHRLPFFFLSPTPFLFVLLVCPFNRWGKESEEEEVSSDILVC